MTSTWIAIEDRVIDGSVEIVTVRNEHGVQGVRIRPREGDLQSFDHFYADLSNHPAVPIIERTPGEVVFASCAPPTTGLDVHRVAIDALDAIRKAPRLASLSVDALTVGSDGRVRLLPRWNGSAPLDPAIAVGRFLQRIAVDTTDVRVERAIHALLDPSPEIRQTARSLLQGHDATPRRTGQVEYTVSARERESRGALDQVNPRAVVLIEPVALAALDAIGRSAAAGIARLPTTAIDGLIAAGLPLVLENHNRAQNARVAAGRIERETGLPTTSASGGSMFSLLAAAALGTTAIVTATSAMSLAAMGLVTIPAIGALLSLALLGFTLLSVLGYASDRRLMRWSAEALTEANEERERRGANTDLVRAWAALSDARSALATADLPAAPASDLRGVLTASERELEHYSTRIAVVRRGLRNVSSADVQRRLNAVDDDDDEQIQRALMLTKTLAEVQALEQERARIGASVHELEAVLAEITGAIGRWESSPDEHEAIDRVILATRQARSRASA